MFEVLAPVGRIPRTDPRDEPGAPWQWLTALCILGSLCNSGASLNDEDLETCGAVVLHELQRLSWSTAKGCLLPQDLVSAQQPNTEPNKIR